jgi:hypothetical protein
MAVNKNTLWKTEGYKLINVHIFHPAFKSVKARCEFTYCNNSEKCAMYKNGKCVHSFTALSNNRCPYGRYTEEEGFTKRANGFYEWMSKREEKYSELINAVTIDLNKLAVIDEYVYLPLPWLKNYVNKVEGLVNGSFIKLEDFTVEKINEIFEYRPQALFGGEIKAFQREHIPRFMQHLKEELPKLYEKFLKKYPEKAERILEKIENFVGRKAYVKTLAIGAVINESNGKFIFDGEYLVSDNWKSAFLPFRAKTSVLSILVTDEMLIDITDNAQVDENTKFFN